MSSDDLAACKEVLGRKGRWFLVGREPPHHRAECGAVPTGPPVSLQPHSLKGESAAWVDERLEEEVARGQLVRLGQPAVSHQGGAGAQEA